MDEVLILQALQQGITAAVDASIQFDLPVSYVDVAFTVPDAPWLEVVHIPNNEANGFWGNEKNHMGLLRLVLHWPNDGAGPYRALELLGSICGYFSKDRLLSGVQISDIDAQSGTVRDGDDTLYAASLRYVSFRRA